MQEWHSYNRQAYEFLAEKVRKMIPCGLNLHTKKKKKQTSINEK